LLNLFSIVLRIVFRLVAVVVIFAEKFKSGECRFRNLELIKIDFDLVELGLFFWCEI